MRIFTVGGGPAGLYFSLLAKRTEPSRQVTVLERNPPDATYGWGVVFSEEALGALRDADRPSYDEITDSFAKWNAIDIRYRGRLVRSRGHAFSAISRKRLLQILQDRCGELGVELRFEAEVDAPDTLADPDLVVGADGVNSTVRRAHEDAFGPTVHLHRTRYAWFGTDLVFKAFTFIFRENEHGLFQVHAYPFDAQTSTFIVECAEDTWRRAGLDETTEEESIAYCEKLFAEDLGGRSLLSNRSVWVSFATVRCDSWHRGKVVLLGDAAHTAHFTIGSGTKLAMDDAIALAEALERHPRDLEAALVEYEMGRQPVVERFQEAAMESARYFERVRRYAGFHPLQFAFNLLTRSGRITHLELEKRDPVFVSRVDRWFTASATREDEEGTVVAPPPMFAPIGLRGMTLENRVTVAPVGEDDARNGIPGARTAELLREAGRSGAALVLTEPVAVSPNGRITPGTPGLWRDDQAGTWAESLREARRGSQVRFGVRLVHAGPRGSTRPRGVGLDRPLREGGWPLVAASDVPHARWSARPRVMADGDLRGVGEDFVRAAQQAEAAGFDLVELDLSHGYLLASFLSPLTNRRTDEHGGSLEGRLRYPLEVVHAVREVWPPDRPLAVRLTAHDWLPGGLGDEDAVLMARALAEHGCDLIDAVAGQTLADDRPRYDRFFLVPYGDRLRNEAGVATLTSGGITTADEVNTILAAGRADLCILDPPL